MSKQLKLKDSDIKFLRNVTKFLTYFYGVTTVTLLFVFVISIYPNLNIESIQAREMIETIQIFATGLALYSSILTCFSVYDLVKFKKRERLLKGEK